MLPCVLYDTWYNTIAVQLHYTDAPPVYCMTPWYNWYNNYYTIAVQLHCTDAPLCTVRHLVQYNSCAITLYSIVQHVEGNLPSSTVLSNSSKTMSKLNFFSSLQEQQKKNLCCYAAAAAHLLYCMPLFGTENSTLC